MARKRLGRAVKEIPEDDWSQLSLREWRIKEKDMVDLTSSIGRVKRASSSFETHRKAILVNDGSTEAIRVFGRPPYPLAPPPPPDPVIGVEDDFDATLASLLKRNSKKRSLKSATDPPANNPQSKKRPRSELLSPSDPSPRISGDSIRIGSGNSATPASDSRPDKDSRAPERASKGNLDSRSGRPPRRGPRPNPALQFANGLVMCSDISRLNLVISLLLSKIGGLRVVTFIMIMRLVLLRVMRLSPTWLDFMRQMLFLMLLATSLSKEGFRP